MNGPGASFQRRHRRVAAGLIPLAVVAGLLAACVEQPCHEGIGVLNSTDVPLTFEYIYPGGTYDVGATVGIGARALVIHDAALWGTGLLGKDGCTIGTLIARDPDGAEVARHGPGLCDTEAWEITKAGPSSSP